MLEKILGSPGKISLLRAMLAGKKSSFSLNELARVSGVSPSTAFKRVGDLLGTVVDYDPLTKKYGIKDTPLSAALRKLFELERETFGRERPALFSLLETLGPYYVSGTSAIILRGLSRDFMASTDSFMVICDRRISKLRGAILSMFPAYRLLLSEERIRSGDYVEGEVYFEGQVAKVNLAILEKAIIDALWRPRWERENVGSAIYCILEQPLDVELLKKYAKEKGPKVEGRLRRILEMVGRATGIEPEVGDLELGTGLEKDLEAEVEETIERVLRS